ncbi:MAG: CDP-glycerol glycerophosphotransferase family protein, partial [Clostridia bacterium]|nr:CDP-glycerol glycerophosphotransferase family protein [Clostridia bacterium]
YSTLDKSFGASDDRIPMHNCYTLVPVSSAEVAPCYADAFRCDPSVIKPLGVPRTDELFASEADAKAELVAEHPELADKTLILYAPTFRGNNVVDAKAAEMPDFSRLDSSCAVLLRMHPFLKGKYKIPEECKGKILDASGYDTNFCLRAADILVTDYSSIIFEYSLLEKPMIFFSPDLEDYKGNRDFYYNYEDFVPGPIVKDTAGLIEALASSPDIKRVKDFRDKYMSACDGHATERIIKELLG